MATENRRPRRPAMLDPEDAEYIIGDEDPAEGSAAAHTSAWAVMGVGDDEFGQEAVDRLRETIKKEGVDVVAHMWARSPEFTLPGALWRVYLFTQWVERDADDVRERFADGIGAARKVGNEAVLGSPDLPRVQEAANALLHGERTDDDLADILEDVSRTMVVLAAGAARGPEWITDENDTLAHPVTVRPQALIATARELDEAARLASTGNLD